LLAIGPEFQKRHEIVPDARLQPALKIPVRPSGPSGFFTNEGRSPWKTLATATVTRVVEKKIQEVTSVDVNAKTPAATIAAHSVFQLIPVLNSRVTFISFEGKQGIC